MVSYKTNEYFLSETILPNFLFISEDIKIELENFGTECNEMGFRTKNGYVYGINIITNSLVNAQYIADILCSAYTVVSGFNYLSTENVIDNLTFQGEMRSPLRLKSQRVVADDEWYKACLILQKSFGKPQLENAICKYHVAHEMYSLHPMDLDPVRDPFKENYLLSDLCRIAYSIINCYSILEELNLQVQASNKNPSIIDSNWNPVVIDDLKIRLNQYGMDTTKKIIWITRNKISRPFKHNLIDSTDLCDWSDGDLINDFNINIVDAILETSFIRSRIASHAINKNISNLTYYDAENAFNLTRVILLEFFNVEI